MAGRIFLGVLPKRNYFSRVYSMNLRGRFSHRSYSTALKAESNGNTSFVDKFISHNRKEILTIEEFKKTHIETLERFKESPTVKAACGEDLEKISRAYESFCLSQYSLYKHQVYGGNPSLMI